MPWKGLLSSTAGGRKSRRYSFLEKTDPPMLEGHDEATSVEPIARPADITDHQSTSHLSSNTASRDPNPPAHETPDPDHTREDIPQRLRNGNAATIPKSHRFSLLRFRHASDPQLSRSYSTSATSLTPPPPLPTSKSLMLRQPDMIGG